MREERGENGRVWDKGGKEIGLKGKVIMDQGSKVIREQQDEGTRERRKKKQQGCVKEAKEKRYLGKRDKGKGRIKEHRKKGAV